MDTGALSPGVKLPGREADHSPPSSAEVKNAWSYTSTSPFVFIAWCLVKYRDNFTFNSPRLERKRPFVKSEGGGHMFSSEVIIAYLMITFIL
jgi:hypothetical protein